MGLGPPVCLTCMLIGRLDHNGWHCGGCGSKDLPRHLWECSANIMAQLESNTRFMRAVWNAQKNMIDEKK